MKWSENRWRRYILNTVLKLNRDVSINQCQYNRIVYFRPLQYSFWLLNEKSLKKSNFTSELIPFCGWAKVRPTQQPITVKSFDPPINSGSPLDRKSIPTDPCMCVIYHGSYTTKKYKLCIIIYITVNSKPREIDCLKPSQAKLLLSFPHIMLESGRNLSGYLP